MTAIEQIQNLMVIYGQVSDSFPPEWESVSVPWIFITLTGEIYPTWKTTSGKTRAMTLLLVRKKTGAARVWHHINRESFQATRASAERASSHAEEKSANKQRCWFILAKKLIVSKSEKLDSRSSTWSVSSLHSESFRISEPWTASRSARLFAWACACPCSPLSLRGKCQQTTESLHKKTNILFDMRPESW